MRVFSLAKSEDCDYNLLVPFNGLRAPLYINADSKSSLRLRQKKAATTSGT